MARPTNRRTPKTAYAVVGEGITEYYYFNNLKQVEELHLKSKSFTIKPDKPKTSNFKEIIAKARELIEKGYDKVFCVLDLDYINNQNVIEEYKKRRDAASKNGKIMFVESMPCFELWLLLHYRYTSQEFQNDDAVGKMLKCEIAQYSKSQKFWETANLYGVLKPKLKDAIAHSKRLDKSESTSKTAVYKIIEEFEIV